MATPKTNIFFTGATGYIGGSVFIRLLNRPDVASLAITALVRSPQKAEVLRKLGVNAVVGTLEDSALLEKLAADADVVMNCADTDDLPSAQAILRGIRKRYDATGVPPIAIHQSGAGVISDNAAGMYAAEDIWDDANADQLDTIAPTQVHRILDLAFINADKEGYVKAYIATPAPGFGSATGKLVDLGIQQPHSILIPQLICVSLDRGQGAMVGEGKNFWANVHIDDMADFYMILYDAIKTNPNTGHGREGIYFVTSGEHTLYELSKGISRVLVQIGRGKSEEPTALSQEEIDKYFNGVTYQGSNARCVGNRARAIGWNPKKTTADLLAGLEAEIKFLTTQDIPAILDHHNETLVRVMNKYKAYEYPAA